ncbi:MAG: hypothetical protein ACRDF7_06100 [Candidatus Limnocylindrales bacterium]
MKVRRVDLVRPDDPAYLAAMSEAAQSHRRLGPPGDPGDIYRASSRIETAVRGWLAERLTLLSERVIDADLLLEGRRSYERRFIELDAVEGEAGRPRRVIEVKFSASAGAVRRGLAQLGRARALLGRRWEHVGRLLVLVEANRSGVDIDRERFRDLRIVSAADIAAERGPDAPLLVLELADLASHLSDADLAAVELGRDQGDVLTTRRRERALEDAGEPEARPERAALPAASVTFTGGDDGDAAEDSPFATLRGLALPPESSAGS